MRNLQNCEIGTVIHDREVIFKKFRIFVELFDLVLFNEYVVYAVLS